MADYGYGCMVYWNLRQTHLQEASLMQILGDHDFFNIFFNMVDFMTDCKAYSITYFMSDKHHQVTLLNW